jgi:hypothetical protein
VPPLLDDVKTLRHPEEIKGTPTLFMPSDGVPCKWTLRQRDGEDVTVPIRPASMTDCMMTLKDAAVAELGAVALPASICKAELSAGSIKSGFFQTSGGHRVRY